VVEVEYRPLTVGRLELALGALDARYISLDGAELVRRLFVGIRDVNWGTVPAVAEEGRVEEQERAIESSMTAYCEDREHQIALRWAGVLRCQGDGLIDFAFRGIPLRRFAFARIGLCVLHPPEFAGGTFQAKTPSGWIDGELEETIAPQLPGEHGFGEPLFPAFSELRLRRRDGIGVELTVSGDLFELEDQRNWGDASFKTYSTPLRLGPQLAKVGEVLEQRVLIAPISAPRTSRRVSARATSIKLGEESGSFVPDVGVVHAGLDDGDMPLELLRAVGLAHLRVDVHLGDDPWTEHLRRAGEGARSLGIPIELAVTGSGISDELGRLVAAVRDLGVAIVRVLAFRRGVTVADPADATAVRAYIRDAGVAAPVFGGTDALFAELNAVRPKADALDGVAFSAVPTIHADDDISLIETMPIFEDIVRTARTFTAGRPLAVTPISLRERPRVDGRQRTLLGAVWTLGSVSALARAGTESLTFFEAAGPRGLLTSDRNRSSVFPLYHVIADVCEWRGYRVVESPVSDPLSVACLAVRLPTGSVAAVIGNALPRPNRVRLESFTGAFRVRRLNEANCEQAISDPRTFRTTLEDTAADEIELAPYEVVRLDASR
jgi:D-apionolactonase